MNNLNTFTLEEQDILNNMASNETSTLTRQRVLNSIDFVLSISSDTDMRQLYRNLRTKVESFSDDSWANFSRIIPFPKFFEQGTQLNSVVID